MNIISFSHSLIAPASAAHFKDGIAADPVLGSVAVTHAPGTVLCLDDAAEAQSLVERGTAVEWLPDVHGDSPRAITFAMNRNRSGANPENGVRRV